MIKLEKKYVDAVKAIVHSELTEFKLYLFGSRVKNCSRQYSDIDIAIKSEELNDSKLSKLKFLFENSTLPYEVDVINLDNISNIFYDNIKYDLTEI